MNHSRERRIAGEVAGAGRRHKCLPLGFQERQYPFFARGIEFRGEIVQEKQRAFSRARLHLAHLGKAQGHHARAHLSLRTEIAGCFSSEAHDKIIAMRSSLRLAPAQVVVEAVAQERKKMSAHFFEIKTFSRANEAGVDNG